MEIYIIPIVAIAASFLTFFSGFGLGTLLLPTFAIFFPIEAAIAMTAIVHFSNNLFKIGLVYKNINYSILLKFGLPAIIFSFIGAELLKTISNDQLYFTYSLFDFVIKTTVVKIVIAFTMIIFAILELFPKIENNINFGKNAMSIGGALSGFFGGLSGHQGALRSAVLIKLNLEKFQYIATGVAIACFVDVARLTVYSSNIQKTINESNFQLIAITTFAAFLGAFIGNKMLKKIEIKFIKYIVGVSLILISISILIGLI